MNLLFWGMTAAVFGKVLLVIGILKAHGEIAHEHKIDAKVLKIFKVERWFTIIGLFLIVLGYALEIHFFGFTQMLTCTGNECAATLGATFSQ